MLSERNHSVQSNLNHYIRRITLGVSDLQRSIEYYEKGLGFPRMESPPDVALIMLKGTGLGLYAREVLVDAVPELAEAAGATIIKKAQKVFWVGPEDQNAEQNPPP